MGLYKLSFFPAKESINKTKKQSIEWEKILVNCTSDKGLINKTYKDFNSIAGK